MECIGKRHEKIIGRGRKRMRKEKQTAQFVSPVYLSSIVSNACGMHGYNNDN